MRRRLLVLFPIAIVGVVLGLVFIDDAAWLLIISGCLLGGLIVDALVEWSRFRKND